MENSFISNYMRRAIELAKKGKGFVNPNPLVGAVIVKDNKIIGEGYHACYGQLHAERNALADAAKRNNSCKGADIYVTLEPCCHTGKQPPCTQALIESGISRVFVGSFDPNPKVSGNGIRILKEAGITVVENVLKDECDKLNPVFFHFIKTKTPYITIKYAMSADGLTSCHTGKSRWVSGEESRHFVHLQRFENMAVMTGIQTVLKDNPLLTCRLPEFSEVRQPIRIVCDSFLRIPMDCNLVKTANESAVIVACALSEDEIIHSQKANELKECGISIISAKSGDPFNKKVDLIKLSQKLGEQNIDSVLLESGGSLNYNALKSGIVQKIQIFIAPKIFGSLEDVHNPVRGIGAEDPSKALMLSKPKVSVFDEDVLLEYEVTKCLQA